MVLVLNISEQILGVLVGDILPFKKVPLKQKHQGNSLCKQGHHKWKVLSERKFDVKQGKLVTVWECERCREKKVRAI